MSEEMNATTAQEAAKIRTALESRPMHMKDGSICYRAQATYATEVPAASFQHPGENELLLEILGPELNVGEPGEELYSLVLTDGYKTWYLSGLSGDRGSRVTPFFTLEEIAEEFPGLEWNALDV